MIYNTILLFLYIQYCLAFNINKPTCSSCKWFIPSKNKQDDYGFCKIYKNKYEYNGKLIQIYEYAKHCRENSDMCGEEGFLYEPIKKYEIPDTDVSDVTKMSDSEDSQENKEIECLFEEYINKCCGEICEKDDLIELEKDYINLVKKIKDLNKKNLKKLNKNIYNFFRNLQ